MACAGDDDFLGSRSTRPLDAVVRRNDQFLSVSGGALNIDAQKQDIHGGDQGLPNIVLQDLPATGPWTATARVTWNPTINYQNAGLMVYLNDGAFIKTGMVYSGGRKFEAFKELNNSPVALGTTGTLAAAFPTTWYIRLVSSDGQAVQAQYSPDNVTWTNIGNATNMNGLDGRQGRHVRDRVDRRRPPTTNVASFDWFKLDHADHAERRVRRRRARHVPLEQHRAPRPGRLHGRATASSRCPPRTATSSPPAPNNNPNVILQPAPSGPWTMTTRMTFNPNENYEQAGLLVYGDDANYVKADLVHAGGRAVEFLREVATSRPAASAGRSSLPGDFPTTVELRIVSDGTTLTASYRPVGGEWAPFGEPAPLSACRTRRSASTPTTPTRTWRRATTRRSSTSGSCQGCPTPRAPVTTHALAPARPTARPAGTDPPVGVTLATEAGATTEYKIGDGAYQALRPLRSCSAADGTHEVTYRSTDAAENVEAAKTVTVKIDRTAPTQLATLDGDGPVTVTLAGADPAGGSGLGGLEYRLDGGAWTPYATPVVVTAAGDHTLEHRATDVAGNVGAVGTEEFSIDGGDEPRRADRARVRDPTSGVAPLAVTFRADGPIPTAAR